MECDLCISQVLTHEMQCIIHELSAQAAAACLQNASDSQDLQLAAAIDNPPGAGITAALHDEVKFTENA